MTASAADWHADYALGIPEIDIDHYDIAVLIRRVIAAAEDEAVLALFRQLALKIAAHCSEEEFLARKCGVVFDAIHHADHRAMIDELAAILERDDVATMRMSARGHLSAWLVEHLRGADTTLSQLLRPEPVAIGSLSSHPA